MEVRILVAIIAAPSVVDVVLPDDELVVNVDVDRCAAGGAGGAVRNGPRWLFEVVVEVVAMLPAVVLFAVVLSMPSWWSWCRADDRTWEGIALTLFLRGRRGGGKGWEERRWWCGRGGGGEG